MFKYLYGAIIGGGVLGAGICEEIGWRGFALPQLQRKFTAFTSSVVIGIAWGLWHWPNYLITAHPHPYAALGLSIPAGIVAACIYTWAFNSTGGSLFTVVVLHGTTVTRAVGSSSNDSMFPIIAAAVSILIVVVIIWRYGPGNMSPCEKVVVEPRGANGFQLGSPTTRL
ncbi:MAG: CPBP family intramembrane metalloprotease [Planctomycetales bacterium]|nr:CPBP family intramembrane metalloprotease [Planctomycetales bacterium]